MRAEIDFGAGVMRLISLAACVAALGFLGSTAQAQLAAGAQQNVSLSSGTAPPGPINVQSGGPLDATRLGGSCVGAVARSAVVRLFVSSNGAPLTISVRSTADTSLVVQAPDGQWTCNDNHEGVNPSVYWSSAPDGPYEIWVGAVGTPGAATILITQSRR